MDHAGFQYDLRNPESGAVCSAASGDGTWHADSHSGAGDLQSVYSGAEFYRRIYGGGTRSS